MLTYKARDCLSSPVFWFYMDKKSVLFIGSFQTLIIHWHKASIQWKDAQKCPRIKNGLSETCGLINVMSFHKIKGEGKCWPRKRADLRNPEENCRPWGLRVSPLPSSICDYTPLAGEFPFGICLLAFPCLSISLKPEDLTLTLYETFPSWDTLVTWREKKTNPAVSSCFPALGNLLCWTAGKLTIDTMKSLVKEHVQTTCHYLRLWYINILAKSVKLIKIYESPMVSEQKNIF